MIASTGATGQLGRLVIQNLLKTVPVGQIVAAVRSPAKAADLAALAEFAAEIAQQSGQSVVYHDLPEAAYAAALVQVGLPEGFAALLADADAGASMGALFDDAKQLSQMIGRPTTPLAAVVKAALAG